MQTEEVLFAYRRNGQIEKATISPEGKKREYVGWYGTAKHMHEGQIHEHKGGAKFHTHKQEKGA